MHKILKVVGCLLVLGEFFMQTPAWSQSTPKLLTPPVTTYYYCPPCGCNSDHVVYSKPGICPEPGCRMKLLASKNEQIGRIAFTWSSKLGANRWALAFYKNLTLPSIVQGLILAFILLFNFRNNRQANIFLAILLFAISFHSFRYYVARRILSDFLIDLLNQPHYNFSNLFIPFSFILIIGPALYFYVKSLTSTNFQFGRKEMYHFLPAILVLVIYTILWLQNKQQHSHQSYSQTYLLFNSIEQMAGIIAGLVYNFYAFKLLHKHRKSLLEQFSNTNAISLGWLQIMMILLTLVWLGWFIIALFNIQFFSFVLDYIAFYPLQIFLAIIIYIIGFAGFIQPQIYAPNMVPPLMVNKSHREAPTLPSPEEKTLQKKSPHTHKIIQAMQNDKLYLNPTLTLNELARHLAISPKVLSQVLNNELNKNFHDFVNEYRVEEVKKRLTDVQYQHLTILGIAFDAGFNSKSTFNRIFLKFTQMSPKQYRNQYT